MKVFFLFILICIGGNLFSQQPDVAVLEYINTYKHLAIKEMKRTGVPAAIKLAQGIHETGAGQGELVLRSNNHFGIKCKSNWAGGKVYHDDDARGECFRSYATPEESYSDHSDFLRKNQRYHFLFELDPEDYKGWAYGLKKAGYATNNRYSQLLIQLIEKYDLQNYSLIALGKLEDNLPVYVKGDKIAPATSQAMVKAALNANSNTSPVQYPSGVFIQNNTKLVYAKAGTSLLALAQQHNINYGRLLEFNDFEAEEEIITDDMLIYLQRKKKTGASKFYVVQPGQSLWQIAQINGIRLSSLLEFNHLKPEMIPAPGELLSLQEKAPVAPKTISMAEIRFINSRQPAAVMQPGTGNNLHYTIQKGDTLYSIARKYGVTIEDLKKWNQLAGNNIQPGQNLKISDK